MISQETIQKVKDLSIIDILQKRITLKRAGINHQAPCPFHDERTASFTVSAVKGIYKCFGCGVSGDGINFIQHFDKLNFTKAIEKIAGEHSIPIVYDKLSEEQITQFRETETLLPILSHVNKIFQGNLARCPVNLNSRLTADDIVKWEIGYAIGGSQVIQALSKLNFDNEAEKIGLFNKNRNDFFQNRIMFPIHDINGRIIGFTARVTEGKDFKYINSKNSTIYNKSKALYGIHFAVKHIQKLDHAILVEGPYDVIAFHRNGAKNTIATCGTSLTDEHCKVISKITKNVTICRDNDKAGKAAAIKDVETLLKNGITPSVFEVPGKLDPDEFARSRYDFYLIEQLEEIFKNIESALEAC